METTGVNNSASYPAYTENAARLTEKQQAELDRVRESIDRLTGTTVRAEDVVDISAAGRAAAQRPGEAAEEARGADGTETETDGERYEASEPKPFGPIVVARNAKAARFLAKQRLDALLAESGGADGTVRLWGA